MRIIAYKTRVKNAKVLLEESTGEFVNTSDLRDLLFFLLEPYENSIKVCWNLDATVSLLLALLGQQTCEKLQKTHKCYIPPFNIFYVPGKVFSVSHIPTHNNANLYELEQYFPDLLEPNVLELVGLGEKLLQELEKMGLKPTKLTSPVAIYGECILSKMDLPKVTDIPREAAEMAYRCSGKLWIESHQIGYWNCSPVYDYDMVSAFPTVARDLVDTRSCTWKQSTKLQKAAIYGYARCQVTIYDWVMVSPIIKETEDGLVSPTGTWKTYLTKGELEFIDKHKIGSYEILDGWWAMPQSKTSKPLYAPIARLLEYKQRTGLQSLLAKRMSTGIYGKFGEEHQEEFGKWFNPVWFAETSTKTRLLVAEFLYAHDIGPGATEKYNTLIHVSVDGAILSEPVENGSDKWKLSYQGEALVISSGLVYTKLTKPKGLRLGEILDMIGEHPRKSYYSKGITRRLTLGDSLAQNRLQDIGKEIVFNSSINLLNQEHDRIFEKLPNTGRALLEGKYQSMPIKVMQGEGI